MSVAETALPETAVPRAPHQQLAISSLLGGGLVLLALWFLFAGLPWLWSEVLQMETIFNPFLSSALLFVATVLTAVSLGLLAMQWERMNSQHGLRAGVFMGAIFLYLVLWITRWFGGLLERQELGMAGAILTVAALGGLLYVVVRMYFRPGFARWLGRFEDQGWFHATSYKANQGLKVRRGTIIGVLTLGICGIYTLIAHRSLGTDRYGPNDWIWDIPFVQDGGVNRFIPLMYTIHLTVPLVLAVALFWFAWRIVNWPAFADFLIATEAEMNKVSWSSRKRLVQDTIMVLITVFLMTVFLFIVDIVWIKVLSAPFIHVLQVDVKAEVKKQQEKSQW